MPLECLLENVIPLDILLHYVGTKQFRYFERERVIHVGTRPKMIERVRKKNKQGIGMLNISLQWLERLLVRLPLPHGQQYHSSWYCLVLLVRPVVVPCCQGSELLEVFLLLANRNAADQVKLARQSRASFYPPLHPHPTLKPISPPHTDPWQRHTERELLVLRQSSSRFQLLPALVEFAIKTNFSISPICWRNWALQASEFHQTKCESWCWSPLPNLFRESAILRTQGARERLLPRTQQHTALQPPLGGLRIFQPAYK